MFANSDSALPYLVSPLVCRPHNKVAKTLRHEATFYTLLELVLGLLLGLVQGLPQGLLQGLFQGECPPLRGIQGALFLVFPVFETFQITF